MISEEQANEGQRSRAERGDFYRIGLDPNGSYVRGAMADLLKS
jgi:hypothetical protein